jgi:hypothetical protein
MATDVGTAKAAAAAKYDTFVASQLARAETRIRTLDLAAAALGFLAGTLTYAVLMVFCDSRLQLAPRTRQTALLLYLLGGGVYLAFTVVRPLLRRINPYYAARKVEATLASAKNSVVNWVDLHDRDLPPAIRGAVGQRAARDLRLANLERAISGRRTGWAGALLAAATVAFAAAFFALGPSPFVSLLARAFVPNRSEGAIATRTRLSVVKPEGGDATVSVGRGLTISVWVDGKLPDPKGPDAVRLQFHYEEGEPYQERLLQPEAEREFAAAVPAIDLRNGFWYRIAGGDALTPEYRISVRATPLITDFLATYHFRPYVAKVDEVRRDRDLLGLRGTEVTLFVRANRHVKEGQCDWEGGERSDVHVERVPEDSQAFRVRFDLKTNGNYRLGFISADGESFTDSYHEVKVIPDNPPQVEITKPAEEEVRLPADGILQIEGKATDDIGVASVVLQAKVGGAKLKPRPYRPDDKMRLEDGGYPDAVDYKDFLDLAKVTDEDGKVLALKAGMVLEYWLQAADACDFDGPHVAESKHHKVLIQEPDKNPARQQQRKEAEEQKKQQEQKQDEKQNAENQMRNQERQEQKDRNAKEQDKTENAGKDEIAKPQSNNGNSRDNKTEGSQGQKDNPDKEGGEKNNQESDPDLNKEQKEQEQRLKDALERQQHKEQGNGKGQGDGKGQSKDDPHQGPGEAREDRQGDTAKGSESKAGEPKDGGQQGQAVKEAGEGKDKGAKGAEPQTGSAKDSSKPDPMSGTNSDAKGDNKQDAANSEPKADAKQQGQGKQASRSESKPGGTLQAGHNAGKDKPEGANGEKGSPKGEKKEPGANAASPENRQALGEKKEAPSQKGKSEHKDASKNSSASAGTSKEKQAGGAAGQADAKPSQPKSGSDSARAAAKPEGAKPREQQPSRAQDATPQDVAQLAKDLQSKDENKRDQAARQLEQIGEKARDPQARADAREALEKSKQSGSTGSAEGKPRPGSGQDAGEPKGGNENANSGSSKPKGAGEPDGQRAQAKAGEGERKPGEGKPNTPAGGSGAGKQPGSNDPTQGVTGPRANTDRPPPGDSRKPNAKPSPPEASRAAALQLEEFKKKVDKNILKDAKMSEEDYRNFLRAYEERARRLKEQAARAEQVPGSQHSSPLPSFSGRREKPADATSGDLEAEDRGLPPAPYRDGFREFTRQMSRPAEKKK